MKPRKNPPTARAKWSDPLSFLVWAQEPAYAEDTLPWKCAAAFRFLQECLDYVAMCQDHGIDVVFQSPGDTKLIRATDTRVVYRPVSA